jgi:enoyl-CoA hydratase/carnithine racemase
VSDLIRSRVRDGVATLTLNRPEKLNAWTPEMEVEWNDRLDGAVTSDDVRAIVVTGSGRGFCAGADAAALGRRSRGEEPPPSRQRSLTAIALVPKPVVAAVNGACVGLGLALALCCDVRFAAQSAKFAASFVRRGLMAEFGVAWLLPRIVGQAHAADLLLSGRTISAEEAKEMGLVNKVVPDAELTHATHDYAVAMARSCSPTAMAEVKKQLVSAWQRGELTEDATRLADFAEGMASLQESRTPHYPALIQDPARWTTMGEGG